MTSRNFFYTFFPLVNNWLKIWASVDRCLDARNLIVAGSIIKSKSLNFSTIHNG
jgi:hypothetical protein